MKHPASRLLSNTTLHAVLLILSCSLWVGVVSARQQQQQLLPTNIQPRTLITNGVNVTPNSYSYFSFNKFGKGGGCGATLIHPDILLTAAHCRRVFDGRGAYVGAETDFGYDGAEFHEDDLVVQHPLYNASTLHNDIMLVKLQTSSSSQRPLVRLNRYKRRPTTDAVLTVVGFGDTSFGGELSANLLQTAVAAYDFEECTRIHLAQDPSVVFNQTAQFCALGSDGRDSCDGDSGGPILMLFSGDDVVQVGIISSGLGCGSDGIPAVYARVSSYVDWIDDQVCQLSSNPPERCNDSDDTTTAGTNNNNAGGNSGGGTLDTIANNNDPDQSSASAGNLLVVLDARFSTPLHLLGVALLLFISVVVL